MIILMHIHIVVIITHTIIIMIITIISIIIIIIIIFIISILIHTIMIIQVTHIINITITIIIIIIIIIIGDGSFHSIEIVFFSDFEFYEVKAHLVVIRFTHSRISPFSIPLFALAEPAQLDASAAAFQLLLSLLVSL